MLNANTDEYNRQSLRLSWKHCWIYTITDFQVFWAFGNACCCVPKTLSCRDTCSTKRKSFICDVFSSRWLVHFLIHLAALFGVRGGNVSRREWQAWHYYCEHWSNSRVGNEHSARVYVHVNQFLKFLMTIGLIKWYYGWWMAFFCSSPLIRMTGIQQGKFNEFLFKELFGVLSNGHCFSVSAYSIKQCGKISYLLQQACTRKPGFWNLHERAFFGSSRGEIHLLLTSDFWLLSWQCAMNFCLNTCFNAMTNIPGLNL